MERMIPILFCFLVSFSLSTSAKNDIPVDNFAALPSISSPLLSPDGQLIAAEATIGETTSVVVLPYGSIDMQPIVQLQKGRDRIESFYWLNNERILVEASFPVFKFGRRYRITKLYAVNIDSSNLQELDLPKLLRHEYAEQFTSLSVIHTLPDDENHILIQAFTGKDPSPAVFLMDIHDSSVEKIVSAAHEIDSWVSNRHGEVLFGINREYKKATKTTEVELFKRVDGKQDEWEQIYTYTAGEDFYLSPVALSDDEKSLVVMTDFELYRDHLRRFDLEKLVFSEVIFEVPGYDLDRAIVKNNKLVGAMYTKDFTTIEYFDEALKSRQQMLSKSFGDNQSYIYSSNTNSDRLVVSVTNGRSPTKFFLVDLNTRKAGFWLSMFPQLENKPLPGKEAFEYTASDGMKLNGYFMAGSNGAKSPLIVLPHGGPRSRDDAHFDIFAQLLARRGYAVLQMNFRGSSGFGNGYQIAGYHEWGQDMQTDVYDAVNWVKENKRADVTNACAVGWSYGGYVTLVAGYQRPDMFKCIVSIAGISDLPELIRKDSFYSEYKADIKRMIGDIDDAEDLEYLKSNSPINHVRDYKAPVLLVQGKNDTKVHYDQAELFYDELDDADKEVELLMIKEATHNLDNINNRIKAFKAIDDFLSDHLD